MNHYLPSYAIKDAQNLNKKHAEIPLICGQLAHYCAHNSFSKNINDFFLLLKQKSQEDSYHKLHFYDIILPERNIYYPSHFFHSFYANYMLKNNILKNYFKEGALFGLLYKQGFSIESSSIRYFGAYASLIAYKSY